MKFPPIFQRLNRNWVMLIIAIFLGLVAVGLNNKVLKDKLAQIDAANRGAHKMVTVVVAKVDLSRGARLQPRDFCSTSHARLAKAASALFRRLLTFASCEVPVSTEAI